jgi:iron complex transport system substrate-binding protein
MRWRGCSAALLLLALAGCNRTPGLPPSGDARRIITLAPSLTETVFALGLGSRVVGVDSFSAWPAAVAALPRLGGLIDPNLERVVTLRPDLALLLPSEQVAAAKFASLGIATLIVPTETLDDVERSFTMIARRCGMPEAGTRLAARWRAELAPQPVPGKPRVLLSISREPHRLAGLLVAGNGTFYDELLARLGGVNVFHDAVGRYPQVGMEDVLARAPEVILELQSEPANRAVTVSLVGDWKTLATLPAVKDNRIEVIGGDFVTVPGPRLPILYRRMREALLAKGGS